MCVSRSYGASLLPVLTVFDMLDALYQKAWPTDLWVNREEFVLGKAISVIFCDCKDGPYALEWKEHAGQPGQRSFPRVIQPSVRDFGARLGFPEEQPHILLYEFRSIFTGSQGGYGWVTYTAPTAANLPTIPLPAARFVWCSDSSRLRTPWPRTIHPQVNVYIDNILCTGIGDLRQ